jgi:hypothetical protein
MLFGIGWLLHWFCRACCHWQSISPDHWDARACLAFGTHQLTAHVVQGGSINHAFDHNGFWVGSQPVTIGAPIG